MKSSLVLGAKSEHLRIPGFGPEVQLAHEGLPKLLAKPPREPCTDDRERLRRNQQPVERPQIGRELSPDVRSSHLHCHAFARSQFGLIHTRHRHRSNRLGIEDLEYVTQRPAETLLDDRDRLRCRKGRRLVEHLAQLFAISVRQQVGTLRQLLSELAETPAGRLELMAQPDGSALRRVASEQQIDGVAAEEIEANPHPHQESHKRVDDPRAEGHAMRHRQRHGRIVEFMSERPTRHGLHDVGNVRPSLRPGFRGRGRRVSMCPGLYAGLHRACYFFRARWRHCRISLEIVEGARSTAGMGTSASQETERPNLGIFEMLDIQPHPSISAQDLHLIEASRDQRS